jgi:2-C-methyl-D-erythritol 4-phosphate cytidylyltransferase
MHHLDNAEQENIWCVVPAAGHGSRMQSSIPKQYMSLGRQTVLETTLAKLLQYPGLAGIVVCLALEDIFFKSLPVAHHPKVHSVIGGSSRSLSVLKGLEFLEALKDSHSMDWVLVHDAARPCIELSAIERLVGQCQISRCGGILAVPVSDTLKRQLDFAAGPLTIDQSNSLQIQQTVIREGLWHAQTPQCFPLHQLHAALITGVAQNANITDEASAIEFIGGKAILVEGSRSNIKITRHEDLAMAKLILQQQVFQNASEYMGES